jgi:hypothetical protein
MGNKQRPDDHAAGRDVRLGELATAQHGVVSARQLRRLGYGRPSITKATAAGRLHRLYRGAYAVGHLDLSTHSHCLAAVFACEPGALLSHGAAAWLWGLYRYRPGTIDITTPTRRHRREGLRIHHAKLTPADRDERDGIPVTSVARTLLDQAARVSAPGLERLLERSEELQLFDLREVDELLGRAGGHPGAGPLRRGLAIYRDEPAFVRSRTEKRFLDAVRRAGLPAPATNFTVAGMELDAYWECERFVVEVDVFETHGTRAAFERDRLRQDELQLLGIETMRVTGPRLDSDPRAEAERVRKHLRRRRRELSLCSRPDDEDFA